MIDAPQLLADLTRLLKRLEDDLRQRIFDAASDAPALKPALQVEWQAARDANRSAETFESWADQVITQAGVHWLLSCVFIRFIEDNGLVERPWLGGTPESGRLALARDRHEAYFRAHPLHSDRDFLLAAFTEAGSLPGLHTFFDATHNPAFRLPISGDAAMALRQFWQQVDPNTGTLAHDFADPAWGTRFLGDLYQDLSEATRKRYALLQTPEFVEAFILDRTLTPAIREFGHAAVRLIDPTCGSGHFLLGAFHRLVDEWRRREPGRNPRDIAQKALDAVAGVDLNPFAVAIARFRLWVAALQVAGVHRMSEAPNFQLNVAIGDSLLHGPRFGELDLGGEQQAAERHGYAHAYASEDLAQVQAILGRQYHAVVGNPPYIVVKDSALNAAYRQRYASCHMKYSLGAPFTERFFELALTGRTSGTDQPGGFVGLITTNSFMKREFGSKLIEQVLPRLDLSHVVDTSGAYIPGHGTPTVILFGRHRAPVGEVVRTVMGIKGEPSAPEVPAHGLVWSAIVGQIDRPGSESEFVSVTDVGRNVFAKHPWSIGGGGAAELKEAIEDQATSRLSSVIASAGFMAITGEDEAFLLPTNLVSRLDVPVREFAVGDEVRDWGLSSQGQVIFPYLKGGDDFQAPEVERGASYDQFSWRNRTYLRSRVMFGRTAEQHGYRWDQYMQFIRDRVDASLLLAFAEVATHNHFVLDRGGKVFKQTAPVIKLPAGADKDDHLGLLGLLNSSVGCFWLKQVCHNKGGGGINEGHRGDKWEFFYAFNSSKVAEFPLVDSLPIDLATRLDTLARDISTQAPTPLLASTDAAPARDDLDTARRNTQRLRGQQIATQDELDWRCLRLYGLLPPGTDAAAYEHQSPPEVALGERAFEIVLARRMVAGTETTTWLERHGSTPVVEIPAHWPEDYRQVVQRRIDLIESDRNIALVERPEYKRRWNSPSWASLEQAALQDWLLARLESARYWPRLEGTEGEVAPQLMSTARLADAAGHDAEFMQIAGLYVQSRAGHADFDLTQLVAELVAAESVPFLPVLRYTDTGLRKHAQWRDTWALQRREDAGEAVGSIPVPPKYQSKDFLKADVWRLRGGLDVPKERWVSYPGCERGADTSLPIAWAGWNHLQQATALAAYYLDMKDQEGWPAERLQPVLAGLLELVPWLKQWHNDLDPVFGERMGDYYAGFVADEARGQGFTLEDLRGWKPVAVAPRRGRRRAEAS